MAHSVGVCEASAVCARMCCRGKPVHVNRMKHLWRYNQFTLLFSFQLAFGAAILNIQIPLMLGELVNVVARYLREHTGNYIREIRGPAFKLLGLYGIQVRQHFEQMIHV